MRKLKQTIGTTNCNGAAWRNGAAWHNWHSKLQRKLKQTIGATIGQRDSSSHAAALQTQNKLTLLIRIPTTIKLFRVVVVVVVVVVVYS